MPKFFFEESQVKYLNEIFEKNAYPSFEKKEEIAKYFHVRTKEIDSWFINKRLIQSQTKRPKKIKLEEQIVCFYCFYCNFKFKIIINIIFIKFKGN